METGTWRADPALPRDPADVAGLAGLADLARHGDRPALREVSGEVTTYADIAGRVARARAELDALDPSSPRHLVHLRPSTTIDFVVTWLAAFTGGHATLLTEHDGLATAYRTSVAYDATAGAWRRTGAEAPDLHPDLRLLLSTSGSTGSPKLVRLSATNVESNATAIATYLGLTPDDVALTTLPLDYCYGLSVLHSHLLAGACVVLDDRSVTDPDLWADARAHGVTSFAGVPYTFDLLASAGWPALPTLRQVTQAGGRMAPDRVRALAEQGAREGWDLVVMYGQTEATARMAYLPPHLARTHPDSVGIAIPGGSFRLEPVDGAAPGVGELVYRGPNVMQGYATSPRDLARGPELAELTTGDLGRITEDGLIVIVGRRARFAKLFGQRIDLDRVQGLLALAGFDVACAEARGGDGLVVAVPDTHDGDRRDGEGRPAGTRADALTLAEITDLVTGETGLPRHTVHAVAVDDLPRLPNGKVDQQAIGALPVTTTDAAGATRPGATGPGADGAPGVSADAIAALFGRILGIDRVAASDSFVGLGGDSLSYIELSLRLESRLGTLPDDWPRLPITDLLARTGPHAGTGTRPGADRRAGGAAARRRRTWAWIETSIVLRALAILFIVGSHTNLWVLVGGAHVLLAVAGANFARFMLTDEPGRERIRRIGRAAGRIAIPAVLWIGAVALVTGDYGWRTVLLLNDLLGSHDWSEPAWYFWFIEVLLMLILGAGALAALPRVRDWEREHRFGLALGLAVIALVPRFWADLASYDGDVIHSSLFVAWLFLGGWAAAAATSTTQRALATLVLLAGVAGFTGDPQRDAIIATGVVLLVWMPTVPWPRVAVRATGAVATASLMIYLTHWQVYPHLEDRWPLGGLLASLAVGLLANAVQTRVTARLPAWRRTVVDLLSGGPRPTVPSAPITDRNPDEEPHAARRPRPRRSLPDLAAARRLRRGRADLGHLQRSA